MLFFAVLFFAAGLRELLDLAEVDRLLLPELLLLLLEASDPAFTKRWNKAHWPDLKAKFAALFASKNRDEWCRLLEGTDVCFAPVLDMQEAPRHPHNAARRTFVDIDGVSQPAPAPRFSRTAPATPLAPSSPGADTDAILADWGFTAESIEALRGAEVI